MIGTFTQVWQYDALRRNLSAIVWFILAGAVGLLVGTQPLGITLLILAASLFLLLAAITPLAGITILMLLAPMRTLIATEATIQLPIDIGQLALAGLLISWTMYRIARGERLFQGFWTPFTTVITIYVIITGLTVFAATSVAAWLDDWLKWVQILILIVVVKNIASGQRWRWLVFALVAGGFANALIGIYEFFGGSGALHLVIDDKFFRAFGTFGQPNPFGGFMGLILPLAFMAFTGYSIRAWKRWHLDHYVSALDLLAVTFYGVASATMLGAIGMSWSRGAWLGLGGAIVVMVFALPRNALRGLLALIFLIGVFGVLWLTGTLPRSVIDRLNSSTQEFFAFEDVRGVDITSENYAVAERLAHWQAALNMIESHPWLGIGLGNYEIVYPQYRLINWPEPLGHAHNYYLNIFAEAGFIGFLGYIKVWLVIIALTWKIRNHPDILARLIGIGLLGTWAYLSIHNFFDNLYVNNLFLHLGLMLGIVAVLVSQIHTSKRLEIE